MGLTYFVCSDVHSFYTAWMQDLRKAGFRKTNPEHIIILCGDAFDRGDESLQVYEFIMDMIKKDRFIYVKGNHESLLQTILETHEFKSFDIHNGTLKTIRDLAGYNWKALNQWSIPEIEFEEACDKVTKMLKPLYSKMHPFYETDKYIFVHGWIPCTDYDGGHKFYKEWRNGNWAEAEWINGMKAWRDGVRVKGKTIVCGHWQTGWGHEHLHHESPVMDEVYTWYRLDFIQGKEYKKALLPTVRPFIDEGIIALDATTVLSETVNILVLEDQQSELS